MKNLIFGILRHPTYIKSFIRCYKVFYYKKDKKALKKFLRYFNPFPVYILFSATDCDNFREYYAQKFPCYYSFTKQYAKIKGNCEGIISAMPISKAQYMRELC